MNIKLPYEIGTILKTVDGDRIQYDRVHHYVVGKDIKVVLELCYKTAPRLSEPIEIDKLLDRWEFHHTH